MDLDGLIERLQQLRAEHGNVAVIVYDGIRSPVNDVSYLSPAPHREYPMIALHD